MKHMRKMMALAIAMVMMVAMGITVFAADTGSITIANAGNISSTHSYEGYQVFKGNLSADGNTLSDIDWGNGVDGTALLTELKTVTAYAACTDAASVAKVLEGFQNDSTELEAFNAIVAKHLNAANKKTGTSETGLTGLAYGYWFVKDVTEMPEEGTDALSAYILQVVGQATLNIKADAPSITKKIVEGANRVDSNNVAIGDTVTYEIKTAVPDMKAFNNYYFYVEDTLSKGLTYTPNSLSVKIGGVDYAATKYTLNVGEYSATDGTAMSIDFKDLYADFNDTNNANVAATKEIVITYSATLNENAIIGETGNPNTVKLTYTNDATWDGTGTPSNGPKGVTPEDKVITYVTEIEITKLVTGTTNTLEGAVFKIEGTTLNKVIVEGEVFTADAQGTYYKLKDGSYTTTAPTAANTDSYASTTDKYKMETKKTISAAPGETVVYEGVSDENGKVKFTGLPAGTYTVTEIAAPAGYNKLDGPITVTVNWTKPTNADTETGITSDDETCTWKYSTTGAVTTAETTATGGKITFNVENAAGASLPSTGGIGTTIFYIIGAILVIGAGVVLVTRRRMSAN